MDTALGPEDLQLAIDSVVGKFLERLRLFRPPVDWIEVAGALPGLAWQPDDHAAGITRKKAAARGSVMLGDGLADEQNQRIAAQAIAHTLMPELLKQMGAQPGEKAPSAWTRLVVGRLMVPPAWFQTLWRESGGEFPRVLQGFGSTPLELLAARLVEGSEPAVVTVIDHGVATQRISNGPRVGRGLLDLEKECLEYVNRFSRARQMSSGAMTVWGWPIHRADWKKELLRTLFVEDSGTDISRGKQDRQWEQDD